MHKRLSILVLLITLAFPALQSAQAQERESIALCDTLNDHLIYQDKENEDFAMMVGGKDGWLYRSRFDLKFRFQLTERTLDSFRRLANALRSKGSELVVVMMPTRGLVHYSHLNPDTEFDHKVGQRSYFKMLDEIRSTGIHVADMTGADQTGYFLKRDNHWTYEGAQFTAKAVAETIKNMPVYEDLRKTDFVTKEINEPKEATHRYAEFINKVCGTTIPRETIDKTFTTDRKDSNLSEEEL